MGRHSHPDELDDAPELSTAAPAASDGNLTKTSPVADLQFVLHNPRLLAACAGAAVAPFICYFAIMIGQHRMAHWALFVGAPLVLAGVLVGALLDRAYARAAAQSRAAVAETGPIMTEVITPASGAPGGLNSRSAEGAHQ